MMFEKSLYDLIRGLRNHKGNENEYIQHSLRECRAEIRGSDMNLKTTALLKLIYLEMFGHDMSWASFHVLEVMSSQKYHQKRVGYLAAVQSFRSNTEVLMLATNLLKKDISSPLPPTISLPLMTVPHLITSSLALSLLSDLLPRLSHSSSNIRKKTVAALYRLALVHPDTLRSAWPRIKDLLMDEEEDSSVTAAIVNIVCELGWRRPRDFLALAPRLFGLLVDGGNNWMAIKIIKLFATLTPLEPRLIKKLLPPLTNLIRTTSAMSLLYECINCVIQGGILESTDGIREGDEIASLCVGKLRGMIAIEGDPNLKYVALLAFHRIVLSHPHLVQMHQDVIMECIDDSDISIRLQALELGAGMVSSETLVTVVERLMKQLRNTPTSSNEAEDWRSHIAAVQLAADSDGEDPEEILKTVAGSHTSTPFLPTDYRTTIIRQILGMCSRDTYTNILDFEWYIDLLIQLIRLVPIDHSSTDSPGNTASNVSERKDAASAIGWELRNVAVRVSTVRAEAVMAASSFMVASASDVSSLPGETAGQGVLAYAAWIVGEYFVSSGVAYVTLEALLHPKTLLFPADVVCAYLQALPKVLTFAISPDLKGWNAEHKSMTSLLLARVLHFLEPLTSHPSLEVQERAVELLELMKLASQAIASHGLVNHQGPLLITRAIPQLFTGSDLNPVAPSAQRKVPLPSDLNLESPINSSLAAIIRRVEQDLFVGAEVVEFESFYNDRKVLQTRNGANFEVLPTADAFPSSYQESQNDLLDADDLMRMRIHRHEKNKDDPFCIGNDDMSTGTSTPFHEIFRNANGEEVDVDSIPIMDLDLDLGQKGALSESSDANVKKQKRKQLRKVYIIKDENIENDEVDTDHLQRATSTEEMGQVHRPQNRSKKSLLQFDSSGIGDFSLNGSNVAARKFELESQEIQDTEMAGALAEVERLRLEMQRAAERVQASDGAPAEGTLVKKKRQKKTKSPVKKQAVLNEHLNDSGDDHEDETPASETLKAISITKKKKTKKKRKPMTGTPIND